jgi:signal transduction histidine kinase
MKTAFTRLPLAWVAATALSWGVLGAPPSTKPEQVTKAVRQYALTSANDFPQRDPQDWRLLGSNDDGKTWTVLDVRKGEVFPERHQRRIFKLTSSGPFNLYRLQVDRVRDPTAADCIQLAEIEPLGATEDDLEPAPIFEDLISAQGENPPLETCWQAFDGQVETKWLDHASQNLATRASWIQWQYTNQASLSVTNVKRLLGLRARASKGYAVRIEGVFAGQLPGTNMLGLLDTTGYLEISDVEGATQLTPGQRILVEGTTQWTNKQVGIAQCRLQMRGAKADVDPKHIALEQSLSPDEDLQWVEAEGKVQFCTWPENRLAFELEDNGRRLFVHVLHMDAAKKPPLSGARVRVRGICEGMLNSKGERVAGALWLPTLDAMSPVVLASVFTNSPEGLVRPMPPGDGAPVLTHIEAIRQLSPEQLVRWPKVKVRGVVTELFGGCIQEEGSGIEVWLSTQASRNELGFGTCVEIEGRGDWATGHGPIIRADKVLALGKGMLPRAEHCSWSELASGRMVDQWVEIDGVVRSTDGSHLLLSCEGGQLMATIRSAPAPLVKRLVDATVLIRGVSVAATDSRGRMQGMQLLVPNLECVEMTQAPVDPFSLPAQRIGSLLQIRGPKEFTHRVKVEGVLTLREDRTYFLQDATGGAMAIAKEDVMLKSPGGGWNWVFWQSARSNAAPEMEFKAGDQLQVAGFPEMRGYSPVLTEALIRKVARSVPVVPVKATVEDIAGGGLDSTLVSIEAVLLRQQDLGANTVLELRSGSGVFQAFLRAKDKTHPAIAPGSRVRVTGVCQVESLPYSELGTRVASFKLLVEAWSNVTVLDRPPWWTLKRALAVAAALVVVLAMAGAWIGILRRQVRERTKQLQREIAEHEITEARLAEEKKLVQAEIEERRRIEAEVERGHRQLLKASRLAGMAEVATSVLHNVGNVLNGANVLALVIVDHVKQSKVPSVAKLAGLLSEHRADLGRFVSEDERGRHLPGYVERLAAHLSEEHARLVDKIKSLTESIQHIKEIVATQQDYAKVYGVLESAFLAEIVEDALRLHEGALARHQIKVVREFEETSRMTIDRHKVLQILFNLLENAKHACDERGSAEKLVTVRIQKAGEGRIQVKVADNGVGIPAENLSRIFGQEFSTKKGGHGFGLHSSVLAAQDMGGSLSAQSEGPGKGAVFILEIPVAASTSPLTFNA